ncbi:zincin-like metallopeptidase domain-containing protein [Azospirillum sp. HJ39]|uniref:zincin-like metallopeptidase domain-containing protein n=1 Tax=Azospirillum sp. HJ39 TaxID=3159496 RepID=UPI0035576615
MPRSAITLNWLQDGALAPWSVVAGHSIRIGRDLSRASGSRKYAVKERTAEIASAFLRAALRIVPPIWNADYIGAWMDGCATMVTPSSAPTATRVDRILGNESAPHTLSRMRPIVRSALTSGSLLGQAAGRTQDGADWYRDALVLVGSNPPPDHSRFLSFQDSTIMHSPYVCN